MDMSKVMLMVKSILMMLGPQLKKADSTEGIKETKEALVGVLELSVVLAERLKDGVGLDDLGALWSRWSTDEVLKEKLKAAVDGYDKIGVEVKDIDAGEAMELLAEMVDYVPKFMDALKKDSPVEEASDSGDASA